MQRPGHGGGGGHRCGPQHGTRHHLPPEAGNHPKVDVWTVGVILGILPLPKTFLMARMLRRATVELLMQFGTYSEQSDWFDKFTEHWQHPHNNEHFPAELLPLGAQGHRGLGGLRDLVEGCCRRDPARRWTAATAKLKAWDLLHRLQRAPQQEQRRGQQQEDPAKSNTW